MTPQEILGLTKYYTRGDLKKQYSRLVQKHHPDKGGDVEMFVRIQEAYEKLKDIPERKEVIHLSLDTNEKELVDLLGKNVILNYEGISFEVFIPYRTRIGDTVKVENILENTSLALKIKGQK
jgi:curved DNA-binding protein CbpA